MSAEELIDNLEKRALLPAAVIGNLRQFVAKSLKIVTPESLAKLLVERGLLTPFQAKQLFEQPAPAKAAASEDELSLAPIDDPNALKQARLVQQTASKKPDPAAKAPPAKASIAATSTKPAPAAKSPAPSTAKSPPPSAPAKPSPKPRSKSTSPDNELAVPLTGAGPLDDLLGQVNDGAGPAGFNSGPLAPTRRRSSISPAVLVSVTAGGLLVALVVGLLIALGRSNGDVEWQLAEKDFTSGADAETIAKLDAFLAKFPNYPRAGAADVYRNVARLRQAAGSKTDALPALAIARDVLPKVVDQPDFVKARQGLSRLLPDLAVRLVKQAKEGTRAPLDQRRKLVEAAFEALVLAKDPRYTPDSQKPWAALKTAETEAALLMRSVDRQSEFERATSEIGSAAAAGNMAAAFERRDRLLASYPELRTTDAIDQLDQELAPAEANALKADHERHKAEMNPRPTPIVSTIVFAAINDKLPAASTSHQPRSETQPPAGPPVNALVAYQSPRVSSDPATANSSGSAIAVFANGTAYWLNPIDGKLLGRRFLGFESFAPQPIDPAARKEFLAYDARHRELARIKAEMATTVWRQPLGAPLAGAPAIRGGSLFCATRTGRLMMINLETGDLVRSLQFPEPTRAGPSISSDGAALYLVTDRGNLFVLDAKDFHSRGVTRLGVNREAVTLAPTEIGKHLVVVDRGNPESSVLRVVANAIEGGGRTVQAIPLGGSTSTPPLNDSGRLIVATDRGEISVFAPTGPPTAPLVKLAQIPANSTADRQPRFLARREVQLVVASKGVVAHDTSGGGNLRSIWRRLEDETVIAQPSIAAGSIVVATRQPGMPGVIVRGLNPASGEPRWETIVAAPLAGEPVVDATEKTLRTVQSLAGLVDRNSVPTASQEVIAAPVVRVDGKSVMPAIVTIPCGLQQLAVVGTDLSDLQKPPVLKLLFTLGQTGGLRASPWSHTLVCAPVAVAENVVVADRRGEVVLLGIQTGEPLAAPFIMPTRLDSDRARRVSMAAAGKSEIVITDGQSRIYRLGLKEVPSPRLAVLAEEPLAHPIGSEIAVVGSIIFSADEMGEITARNVADLKPVKSWPLGVRVQWGPIQAGAATLAATDRELICFDSKPELVWRKPLPTGVPVGSALTQGADFVLASMTGTLWRVDRQSGEVKKSFDLGEPLASGPVAFDKHWTIAAVDGSLLFIAGQ